MLYLKIHLFRRPVALMTVLNNNNTFCKIYLYIKTYFQVCVSDKLSKKAKGQLPCYFSGGVFRSLNTLNNEFFKMFFKKNDF